MHERLHQDATVSRPGDRDEREAERVAAELAGLTPPEMAQRLGFDFSRVRIHSDPASAKALGAQAYAANGRDIVLGEGGFTPRNLAHELVHLGQQAKAPSRNVIHRQPAALTPAENVAEAVKLLSGRQPVFIFQALSAAPVGGAAVQVHSVRHVVAGKPVTSVFNLQVKVMRLSGFSAAEFQAPRRPAEAQGTRTFNLEIHVDSNTANHPPVALARDLFHEGMHMRLYIDRAVPSWDRSNYLKGFQAYLDVAHKSTEHAPLLSELTTYIVKNVKGKSATAAAGDAREIIDRIMEEKYAINAEVQIGPAKTDKPFVPDRSVERRRVTRWLSTYLSQLGVTNFDVDQVGSMAAKLSAIWIEIDLNAPAVPLYPVPLGLAPTTPPDINPSPAPVEP
jgi:hypothetical protein